MEQAKVGDTVECDVREPYPQTHRLILETQAAADYATKLLNDPRSGWRKANSDSHRSNSGTKPERS